MKTENSFIKVMWVKGLLAWLVCFAWLRKKNTRLRKREIITWLRKPAFLLLYHLILQDVMKYSFDLKSP